jgi:hypothetical protein
MDDEKTRENMIRAAKELRAFYRSLATSEETIRQAMKAELSEMPKDNPPRVEPNKRKSDT